MAIISNQISYDEKTYQGEFYKNLFGEDYEGLFIDRSTDGYTRGILFEHKTNIQSYGESKALGQALIYLTRFNRDGVPVPAKICLVGQEEQKCYIYDTKNYMHIINDIPKYANMKASDGIPGFSAGSRADLIKFDMSSPLRGMQEVLKFVQKAPQVVKVDINVHNVYGWANYYYDHAAEYKQKAEKKKFFEELRNPVGTLEEFINPWTGQETDFKFIMDMLNDPMTQKKLGAFYTPRQYCELGADLLRKAIAAVPSGYDYVICDVCAGTGNLEEVLTDEELSHVIVNTYELKEWYVLKDRIGPRCRYVIPPIPAPPKELPDLNKEGFLSGANALTKEFVDNLNNAIEKTKKAEKVVRIWYMNPPYIETTGIEFQKKKAGKVASSWKDEYVVREMKKAISGVTSNDMGNAFIWSAFNIFNADYCVVYSPVKYWKVQHLIDKKFLDGYAVNRKHFHAPTPACIMIALWKNETDAFTKQIKLQAYDIDEHGKLVDEGEIAVKQIFSLFSEKYYDNRKFADDVFDGIACELDGTETHKSESQIRVLRNWNKNIVGYILTKTSGFDNPRLSSNLLIAGKYDANGCYIRSDNFIEKLPLFAASRFTDNYNNWKIMSMVMKSGDKAEQYHADIKTGKLDKFLCQCLIWTSLTHYSHMRSLHGSDGRFYRNELCFDNLDGKTTLAREKLEEFVTKGYELSGEEKALFAKWEDILEKVHDTEEYNPKYTYGLYQIDEEINIKIQQGVKKDGSPNMVTKYGDLNNLIKDLKGMVKAYYLGNLVDTLFEYEFLK